VHPAQTDQVRTCDSLSHMRFLVPAIAALVPLIIAPGALAYFDVTPKIAALLIGVALILLYVPANLRKVHEMFTNAVGRYWVAALGAIWTSSVVATAFSTNAPLSLSGSIWRRFGLITETAILVYVLVASAWMAADRSRIRVLLRSMLGAGTLSAVYGISQYFGWDPFLPESAYHAGDGPYTIVRPPGTLGHADYFAAWLVVIVFLGIANAKLEGSRRLKYASFGPSVLAAAAVLLTGTRSALLAIIVGATVLWIAEGFRVNRRFLAAASLGAALLVVFFLSPAGMMLRARVHWSFDDATGGARLLLWRDSFTMAIQRPIAGYGPETFATEFPRFQSVALSRAYPDFYHESPHNMFLDALTSRGALGLLALLGVCGLASIIALRLIRAGDSLGAPLAAALSASLVCQEFIVFTIPTVLSFYLLLAILVATAISKEQAAAPARTLRGRWLLPVAVPCAMLFTVLAVQLVVSDAALSMVDDHIFFGDAAGAARLYAVVRRWEPAGTGSDLRYSFKMQELAVRSATFAGTMMATQEARKSAIDATRTAEDRQNAWYNLAKVLANGKDSVSVEHSLRDAIAWSPNWFKPHWSLAELLAQMGQLREGVAEAEKAVELDGGHDPEVTESLRRLQARLPSH